MYMSSVEATSLILLKGDHPLTSNIRQRCSASDQYWLHHAKSPLDKACLSFVQGSRKGQGSRKEKMSSRDWNKHNSYFKILASVLTKLIIQRITKWFFCSIPFFKLRDNNRGQINFTIARPSISGIPRFTCTIVWSLGIVAHGISTAAVKSARTLIDIWKELPLF